MGGGVEQLLMVVAVLLTTGGESSLFLEPEEQLHVGAQRYLIEKLYEVALVEALRAEALLGDPDPSGEWTVESTARIEFAVDVEPVAVVGVHRGDQTVATCQ